MIGRRVTRSRPLLVLGLGAAVLLIAAAASVAARPTAAPSLPPISSDRLIASSLRALARDPSVSGHLTAHLDFGLPSIPTEGPGAPRRRPRGSWPLSPGPIDCVCGVRQTAFGWPTYSRRRSGPCSSLGRTHGHGTSARSPPIIWAGSPRGIAGRRTRAIDL